MNGSSHVKVWRSLRKKANSRCADVVEIAAEAESARLKVSIGKEWLLDIPTCWKYGSDVAQTPLRS